MSKIHSWLEYLAFLSWQGVKISLEDFKTVHKNSAQILSVNQMSDHLSNSSTRHYLQVQKDWYKMAESAKKDCLSLNVKTTWPFHPDYPLCLLNMENPPLLITWRGRACWKNHFLFSIVGSRNPYQDTMLWMDMNISPFLKKHKGEVCVTSGGARGVDQKAHLLSISTQTPTLCFLPCGIQNYYPSNLAQWEKPILDSGGAFISVFPFQEEMRKAHFHTRNKVLAYFSHLIFIAQAQIRSGTMVTARYGLHAGTTIATIPGSPLHSKYAGNLNLINDGCFMLRDQWDLETLYQSIKLNQATKNFDNVKDLS